MNEKGIKKIVIALLVFISCTLMFANSIQAKYEFNGPNENGKLSVKKTRIINEHNEPVKLRGISMHGLNYFDQYINQDLFNEFSNEWEANLVRLPMYVSGYNGYCEEDSSQDELKSLIKNGIDYATNANMYVIVDWHALYEENENDFLDDAIAFFDEISSEYNDHNNIIYEIYNEPYPTRTWKDIKSYALKVIPVIRKNDPDAIIVVGTQDYSDRPDCVIGNEIEGFDNIMYSFHYYASSHNDIDKTHVLTALAAGIPIFITECGITERDGSSSIDYAAAKEWLQFTNTNHLNYTIWNFSNKDELSAMVRNKCTKTYGFSYNDLSESGKWVKTYFTKGEFLHTNDENRILVFLENCKNNFLFFILNNEAIFTRYKIILKIVLIVIIALTLIDIIYNKFINKNKTYNDLVKIGGRKCPEYNKYDILSTLQMNVGKLFVALDIILTTVYLVWRAFYSLPIGYGVLAIICNILLLIVEILGFFERMTLNLGLTKYREYETPEVDDKDMPDVDIFIATYNEPVELLRKTVNGCLHMNYPDKSKVHIYICDDNRRAKMREMAEEMGVGYFDRPDNKGAKAGNLNNALSKTTSPYIVTFDADMIPRRNFLMKTIPFFVDAKLRNDTLPKDKQIKLGLMQTPQSFYTPDLFQHSLYMEKHLNNEQDFFYRTIQVARTSTNSVIYGGSNTILAREALEAVGGFYTECITEDFATGLLIEKNGFVSLATNEPLASGEAPFNAENHIKQRIRWGRGVISTALQIKLLKMKGISVAQKCNYLASVLYWFLSFKNFIYILSPLVFSILRIYVFKCSLLELILFWLPSFIAFRIGLRTMSRGRVSHRWSKIYDMVMTPFLFFPILDEITGHTMKEFKVTDKSKHKNTQNKKIVRPFNILILISIVGLGISLVLLIYQKNVSLIILLYWIISNLTDLIIARFVALGRDYEEENIVVTGATEFISATKINNISNVNANTTDESIVYEGIATKLTNHNLMIFFDNTEGISIGDTLNLCINNEQTSVNIRTIVTGITIKKHSCVFTVEILEFLDSEYEYWQILYDRIPSLPQKIRRDGNVFSNIFSNTIRRLYNLLN